MQLIAAFLSLPVPEQSPHLRWPPQLQKERTFEALAALSQRLTEERPVLAIIEDLHWADPSTMELLGFLLARAGTQRLCVLLSARPPWMPSWPERSGFQVLALERLPAELTEALVQAKVGGRGLSAERIAHLAAQTDGIPLFIEEIARMVLARSSPGAPPVMGAEAIPITLHELLLARLDGLPRRQKALAQLCAVVGRGLDPALLSTLTGHSEATLLHEFSGLLASGLLQLRDEGGPTQYEFRHALLQEAAAQSLPRGVRRQHHQRIAEVLATRFPEAAKAQPERLAHHYTQARELGSAVHWGGAARPWGAARGRAGQPPLRQSRGDYPFHPRADVVAPASRILRAHPGGTAAAVRPGSAHAPGPWVWRSGGGADLRANPGLVPGSGGRAVPDRAAVLEPLPLPLRPGAVRRAPGIGGTARGRGRAAAQPRTARPGTPGHHPGGLHRGGFLPPPPPP